MAELLTIKEAIKHPDEKDVSEFNASIGNP